METKTPRRSLLHQLATVVETPASTIKQELMACDSPEAQLFLSCKGSKQGIVQSLVATTPDTLFNSDDLWSPVLSKQGKNDLLCDSDDDQTILSQDSDTSLKDQKNPFQDTAAIPKTVISPVFLKQKVPLKFKDQNQLKPPIPTSIFEKFESKK